MKKTDVSNSKSVKHYTPAKIIITVLTLFTMFLISNNLVLASKTKTLDIKKIENQALLTIGTEKISFKEVKNAYDKNSMRGNVPFEAISRDEAMEFLDLYSKYRVKAIDGRKQGYHLDSSIQEEIKRNKRVLAESFLLEAEVIEPNVRRFTDMRKVEKKIAVIVANFLPDGDTVEAFNKINNALQEIKNGESFEYAASKYSSDTTTGKQGGVMPMYLTGLRVQKDMENAIWSLKLGEYTKQPIRTGFSYFLIKLVDEKPREFIEISHILIPFQNENEDFGPIVADTVAALALADSLHKLLERGEKFDALARRFSSDKSNSDDGGKLGIYSRSTGLVGSNEILVPEFETAAFALRDKQVSKPIETMYGFHLIRRDSTVIYPADFEAEDIKNNYRRLYFQEDKQRFYDSLAVALCKFKINEEVMNELLKNVDTTKTAFDTNFVPSIPASLMPKTLYSINDKNYTVEWFAQQLLASPEMKITATNKEGYRKSINVLIEPIIIETATTNITKTHPHFNPTIDEYVDGIILFHSQQLNIWDKLHFDTVRARRFYDTTSIDLTQAAQYDISEIFVLTKERADEIYAELRAGKISFEDAATAYTQRNAYRDRMGRYGLLAANHPLARAAYNVDLAKGDFTVAFKYENGYSIVKLNDLSPARKKTLEESLPLISAQVQSEFQKELEQNWLNRLLKDYKITINQKLFNEIFGKK
jgi:peptidyl-prolyl cis-trans isomerase SurA